MKKLFIISIALLLLAGITVPGMAKVKIGGIVFTDFYYLDRDKANAKFYKVGDGNSPYTVTAIQVPDISRLYARWFNEDNVGMYIELGIGQGDGGIDGSKADGGTNGGVKLRHAYGWWDVTPMFQIMAGQSTTPFSPLNPSQLLGTRSGSLNSIGVGYGEFYSGRFVQVRGTFKFGRVARLAIALVDPNGGTYLPTGMSGQNNTKIPRIDIGVPIYLGFIRLYPSFLYQHRSVDNVTPAATDNSLDSYIGSLGFKAGFGPFRAVAEGNWGKNWGNTRSLVGTSMPALISEAFLDTMTNQIEDAETYSFWVDLSCRFGPITPHVMYGQMKTKTKAMNATATGVVDREAKTQFYGLSIPIDLAKGLRLRPEFMWYDDGDDKIGGSSTNLGKYAILGVQFQITF